MYEIWGLLSLGLAIVGAQLGSNTASTKNTRCFQACYLVSSTIDICVFALAANWIYMARAIFFGYTAIRGLRLNWR